MSIIYWIVFGLIAGAITSFIVPGTQGGILGLIILGIIGAVVGGYLGQKFFGVGVTGFNVNSFIVAVIGSILVLLISSLLFKR